VSEESASGAVALRGRRGDGPSQHRALRLSKPGPRRRRFTPWRRATQAAVALLYLALPFANAAGWRSVAGTLASLKVGPLDFSELASALSAALAARSVPAVLLLGVLPGLLLSLALGGVFCSWICPFGLLSEGVDAASARLGVRKGRLRPHLTGHRARTRLGALVGLLVLSVLLGTPFAALLSPPRVVTALPLEAKLAGGWPSVTGTLLLALFALELLRPRLLCASLCPAGTLASLVRHPRGLMVAWDETSCSCPPVARCQAVCPWAIDPRSMRLADGCTNCMACVDGCPTASLRPEFGPLARVWARQRIPGSNGLDA
jgi:ferredoxin-type protein NapH